MLKQLTNYAVILSIIVFSLILVVSSKEEYDVDDYCGIPPYPAKLNPIPELPEHHELKSPKLVHFHTFIRHGDRSTIIKDCFSGLPDFANRVWEECPDSTSAGHNAMASRNPYRSPYIFEAKPIEGAQVLDGNCHHGQLTRKGALMSYNNGARVGEYVSKVFAKRDSVFGPNTLTLRSTNVHRTRESATSFITGLLDKMPKELLAGQSITPVVFVDAEVDPLKINSNMCKAKEYLDDVYATEGWKQYEEEEWKPLEELTRDILKQPNADIRDVFDCGKTWHCHGKDLPKLYDVVDKRIENAMTYYWAYPFSYDHNKSSKVFSGVMTIDLLNVFSKVALRSGDEDPTFTLYSGHDFGPMMNIISLFQIDRLIWPPYSAMLNVEMYHVDDDIKSYMRFIYNEIVYIPKFCTEKAVGELCPTNVVIEFLTEVVPTTDDCPLIPRKNLNIDELKELYHQARALKLAGAYYGAPLDSISKVITVLERFDQQLQTFQEQQPLGAPREVSHLERWSTPR